MKKGCLFAVIIVILLVVGISIPIANSFSSDIGTYEFESMDDGCGNQLKVGDNFNGSQVTKKFVTLKIYDDGTYVLRGAFNFNARGKWNKDGSDIILCDAGGWALMRVKKNGLSVTVAAGGATAILKKSIFSF